MDKILGKKSVNSTNKENFVKKGVRITQGFFRKIMSFSNHLVREMLCWVIVGLLLMMVSNIDPTFASKYPVLFKVGTAGLQIAEFLCKFIFGLFGSLFNGKILTYFSSIISEFWKMITQFFSWIRTITF